MKSMSGPVRPGRPRAFDIDGALEKAMRVFWEKGYEGASLSDLTEAMGINRPSLYAAFGNKESLFRKVLDRYGKGPAAFACAALNEPTARKVAEKLLRGTADMLGDPGTPAGCLVIHGALACGEENEDVRRELKSRRADAIEALRKRFVRAKREGDLAADADPLVLARYLSTVTQGMSVQVATGATHRDLLRIAETAMRAWPD